MSNPAVHSLSHQYLQDAFGDLVFTEDDILIIAFPGGSVAVVPTTAGGREALEVTCAVASAVSWDSGQLASHLLAHQSTLAIGRWERIAEGLAITHSLYLDDLPREHLTDTVRLLARTALDMRESLAALDALPPAR